MTVCTADHRAISACARVYRSLREVDRLLTEARDHVLDSTAALEDPADACRAVELLRLAGQKRADAHEEARAGLRAMASLAPPAEAGSGEAGSAGWRGFPDHRIRALVEAGELGISLWRSELLQPASVDVTLGSQSVVNGGPRWCEVALHPSRFVQGHTTEHVRIPDYLAAQVDGKSTWGRRGLLIHSTAGGSSPGSEARSPWSGPQ
jgi:hypothetical protein